MKIPRYLALFALNCCLAMGISSVFAAEPVTSAQAADAEEELGQRATIRYAHELFHDARDPVGGNPQGKVTIVEFFDFRCGHCINMFSVLQDLMHRYPELRIVYKNYPVLGPQSDFAARAALAANLQGKYLVFQAGLIGSDITTSNVFALAKQTGLDVPQLKAAMDSDAVERELRATSKLADSLGLSGTPAFFIASSDVSSTTSPSDVAFFPGEVDMDDLEQVIKKLSH